ncbi:hypothetical protein CL615_02425 [archaeon]|mgnify:CR=1 FL=1|jgi:NAD(P)H-flavin reductase|nr:hypothetical protein [archaeon]MDP6547732.1 FAD-binding oxidoreductase [Candidatus Woesearchaeota archaeon]|tara:strand:+ start:27965 stop:28681 length:717 start_codon:yes stop_codon:yes gene_type:complete
MNQKPLPIKENKLKIKEIIDEAPNVKTFRLEIPEDLTYYAGQFFMVWFEDNPKLHRAYSVSSSPTRKGEMEITVILVKEFTSKLFKCKPGDYLIFKGPYGRFLFTDDMKNHIVLMGGGLGITPLMSIVRYCHDKKLDNKINLIYSARTPDDIVYKEELDKIKKENPHFHYHITITRPEPHHKWDGSTGRIDRDLVDMNIRDIENSYYYISGPIEFVNNKLKILNQLGAKKEHIHKEAW